MDLRGEGSVLVIATRLMVGVLTLTVSHQGRTGRRFVST